MSVVVPAVGGKGALDANDADGATGIGADDVSPDEFRRHQGRRQRAKSRIGLIAIALGVVVLINPTQIET